MRVLVTGGAGYIGSHTLLDLLESQHEGGQHEICVIDNYSNASPEALVRVRRLSNRQFRAEDASTSDAPAMNAICKDFRPDAVIHFAGLKAVAESEQNPLLYYEQNLCGTLTLLRAMDLCGCRRIVFSSSATVYGQPHYLPYDEKHPCAPVNPYGRTKYFIEEIIRDWATTDVQNSAMLLRYFNPVGAHRSGEIGEAPQGTPNNLMPYIAQVAVGQRDRLMVYGNDYETSDGTGVRDYIHVSDLAAGHVAALDYAANNQGVRAVNLGTGRGHSVLEMIAAFEAASGKPIPYEIKARRKGDIAQFWADPTLAKTLLGWEATRDIDEMCKDVWHWQSQNPMGY